jgi:hypothetical protein
MVLISELYSETSCCHVGKCRVFFTQMRFLTGDWVKIHKYDREVLVKAMAFFHIQQTIPNEAE